MPLPDDMPSLHRRAWVAALAGVAGSTALAQTAGDAREAGNARDARSEVEAAERAFARTMADRDFDAFMATVAPDAVFLNGGSPLRGREAVGAHWTRFFKEPAAPFSWAPEQVEVLAGGELAMTVGPAATPDGRVFAYFYSVWRREAPGRWRVVFDNGYAVPAACPAK